jgi:hypothetical protein
VRREWSSWYFGDKPDMEEVLRWQGLSNYEKFQEGILRLRKGAQYEPTVNELQDGSFKTDTVLISSSYCESEVLQLHLSDIYQRYAESCYDGSIHQISVGLERVDDFMGSFSVAFNNMDLDVKSEPQYREMLYRSFKVKSHLDTTKDSNENACTNNQNTLMLLTRFDDFLCGFTASDQSLSLEIEDNTANFAVGYKDMTIQYSRAALFRQHRRVCPGLADVDEKVL